MQRLIAPLFAIASLGLAGPAAAALFTEDFDGKDNVTVSLDLTSQDVVDGRTPVNTTHTVASDKYNVVIDGSDFSAARFQDNTGGTFQVSADFSPVQFDSSGATIGLFARNGSFPNRNGVWLRVFNTGVYTGGVDGTNGYEVNLLNNNTELDTTGIFDLTDAGDAGTFNLTLTGIEQPNGDFEITGTFTPDPNDNPAGVSAQTLTATVAAGDIAGGDFYGIRGQHTANTVEFDADNFQAGVGQLIPEPASLTLLAFGSLLIGSRRGRCA